MRMFNCKLHNWNAAYNQKIKALIGTCSKAWSNRIDLKPTQTGLNALRGFSGWPRNTTKYWIPALNSLSPQYSRNLHSDFLLAAPCFGQRFPMMSMAYDDSLTKHNSSALISNRVARSQSWCHHCTHKTTEWENLPKKSHASQTWASREYIRCVANSHHQPPNKRSPWTRIALHISSPKHNTLRHNIELTVS